MNRLLPRQRSGSTAWSSGSARRAFVGLKSAYLDAAGSRPGPRAEWLRCRIRHAAVPAQLWPLRAAVFEDLPAQRDTSGRDRPHGKRAARRTETP